MITTDGGYIKTVVQLASEEIDSVLEGVRNQMGSSAIGMKEPTPEQLASFFFHQNAMYPPEQFTMPDGSTVIASPWVLALGFCENGDEWLKRFQRFVDRNGGI